MRDILDEIIANKRIEVEQYKRMMPLRELATCVEAMLDVKPASMSKALQKSETGIIAEFKRKSPSLGWIFKEGRAEDIPFAYQENGAAALSILTDEKYFGGRDEFIETARRSGVTIPVLYKNFVIDEYQLFQARKAGASAVLLIAAALSISEFKMLKTRANELGLEVLLEMHSREELDYVESCLDELQTGQVMCGVNNRNLGTFVTDIDNSFRLAELLPVEAVKVSESGISSPSVVKELREVGYSGFLIGERFMKTGNPGNALAEFLDDCR